MNVEKGLFILDVSVSGTFVNVKHDDFDDVVGQGPIDIIHDQNLTLSDLRLSAEYAVADGFGIGAVVPLRLVHTTIQYFDMSGSEVTLVEPGIHHRNETLQGFGDPEITGHITRAKGSWTYGARVGASLPVGRTEQDPFALGDQGLRHQHVQFGTGSIMPVVAAEAAYQFDAFRLQAFARTRQSIYENDKAYLPGDQYAAALTGVSPLGTKKWTFRAGLTFQREQAERWNGVTPTEGNTGRTDLLATAGATWRFGKNYYVSPSIQVPLFNDVQGGQLTYPLIAGLSFGRAIAPPHEHGDEHGDEHDDHADHGNGEPEPEALTLVPVLGKITVFDFWADWCKPCVILDKTLKELEAAHPQLVVKRINVDEHHVHLNIPHLKVYGIDGKLLWERTGGAEELGEAVEKLFVDERK